MQSLLTLFRLSVSGLFLEPLAYREQRDAPNGLGRGFALVALIGLLVGLCAFLGDSLELLSQPSPAAVSAAIAEGVRAMPFYKDLTEADPSSAARFDALFQQGEQLIGLINGGMAQSLAGVLTTPLLMLIGWLLGGSFVHLIARLLGGQGAYRQTLSATALSAGAQLLGLVQIIPFAQVSGTVLLGLFAYYVAIREVHGLPPGRAFWATAVGPLLLGVLGIGLFCVGIFLFIGALASATRGL